MSNDPNVTLQPMSDVPVPRLPATTHYKVLPDGNLSYFDEDLVRDNPFESGAQRWLVPGDNGYMNGIDPYGIFVPELNYTGGESAALDRLRRYQELHDLLAQDKVICYDDLKQLETFYNKLNEEYRGVHVEELTEPTEVAEGFTLTSDTTTITTSTGLEGYVVALIVVCILVPLFCIFLVVWRKYCTPGRSRWGCRQTYERVNEDSAVSDRTDPTEDDSTWAPREDTPYLESDRTDDTDPSSSSVPRLGHDVRRRLPALEARPSGFAIQNSLLILSCFTQVLWIVLGYFLFKRYKKSRADAARREMVIPLHD